MQDELVQEFFCRASVYSLQHCIVHLRFRGWISCSRTNKNTKGQKETLKGDGYVYDLDCGNGITDVCICPNSSKCMY